MFENRIEFLPNYKILELPENDLEVVCDLARFIVDSDTAMVALLKLTNEHEELLELESSSSKIENLLADLFCTDTADYFLIDDFNNKKIFGSSVDHCHKHPKFVWIATLPESKNYGQEIICIYDEIPKKLVDKQIQALKSLVNQTGSLFAFHKKQTELDFEKTFVDNKNITIGNYLEANGTGFWHWDLSSMNLTLGTMSLEILGYQREELNIRTLADWIELVYYFDQEKFIERFGNWSNNNLLEEELECRMVHKSGEIVFLNIKISESRINDKAVLTELDGEIQDITTQKKVWEQIDLINPGYTSVLQAGYNWLTIVDINGNYIYVNKALEKALGYSSEELIGQNIFSFVHESDNGKAANHFSKFINNKPFVSKPFRFRCKNGSWKWIEILMVDLYDDPMIQGIVINARDITERVLINKEIKASEEKHRLLFNTSPFPKYILEPNSFKIVDVNDAMLQFYGYTREELLTMSAKDLRPNEEIDKLVQGVKDFQFQTGTMKSGIYTHKKKDGELVKMEIVGQHLVLDQIKCILVTCNDVTDREAYLNNLKQSELKLKSATTIAKLGYWSVDPIDLSFVCSDEFYKIWGRNPETFNFSFETFMDTIHPEDKEVLTSENDKAILQKRKYEIVYRIILPDNSIKWIQHVGQPINGPDGNYTKLEGTVQDITDLKSTQLQIEKTNEEKNNILESIGDAFISVDHNWTVTYWNSVAEKVLMVEKDDIMGKNLWNVMENHIESKAFLKYYKSIHSGNTIYFQDYFSSFNKWLEVSAYPSENNLSLYIRDISDKQHSEFAIQKQNDKLREIAWTQSHVVRAPLARLMGLVDLFREGLLDENEKKPMLDHIYTSAIELDDIIQEIVSKSQSVISNE